MSDYPTHKPKELIRWLSLFMAVGLAIQSGSAAATAQSDTSPPVAPAVSAAPDAEPPPVGLAVSSYASDYSVSLTEAQRRLDRIQPLQEILASIRDLESARLAGWGIDHGSSFGGWVWLTGDDPPDAAAAAVADAHADVRIRTGADHSHAELLAAHQRLFRNGAVGRVNDGPASSVAAMVTFTGINMAANAVRVGIDPALAASVPGGLTDTGPATVTDETFQTKAAEVTEQLRGHINVNYVVEDGRGLSIHAGFMGGETIGGCTSGFVAKQPSTHLYGIVTAAHCTKTPQQSLSMHGVRLSPVTRQHGPYVDAMFLSVPTGSSHRLFDDFVCADGRVCDVTNTYTRDQNMMNSYICHYGRRSRHSCGTVEDISYRPSHDDACARRCGYTFVLVRGPLLKACYGDSGGPWYSGGFAYGIHGGGSDGADCVSTGKTAYFSTISRVEEWLGVVIQVGGTVTVP